MTALIKAGAFDSICQKSRKAMVSAIEADILKGIRKEQSSIIPGQISLFNIISEEQENLDITDSFNDMREYSKKNYCELKRKPLDFTYQVHPLMNIPCISTVLAMLHAVFFHLVKMQMRIHMIVLLMKRQKKTMIFQMW